MCMCGCMGGCARGEVGRVGHKMNGKQRGGGIRVCVGVWMGGCEVEKGYLCSPLEVAIQLEHSKCICECVEFLRVYS